MATSWWPLLIEAVQELALEELGPDVPDASDRRDGSHAAEPLDTADAPAMTARPVAGPAAVNAAAPIATRGPAAGSPGATENERRPYSS